MGKLRISFLVGILAMATSSVFALDDVQFTVTKKKLDESKARDGMSTTVTKEIAYKVTLQSKTAREMANVSVVYNIYYESSDLGSKGKPDLETKVGKHAIDVLKANYTVNFETDPIKLETAALDGNVVFIGGGSGYTKDKVLGVWFKAFDGDGKLLGEYSNPTTITKKMTWKDG